MRALALLVFVLAGCAAVKDEPSTPVHIVWQKVDDVQAACEGASGKREMFRILGCSKWREDGGQRTCTIYAQSPRNETDTQRFATLGHELMHCMEGNWHDRWGRMTPREGHAVVGASRGDSPGAAVQAD